MSSQETVQQASKLASDLLHQASNSTNTAVIIAKLIDELDKSKKMNEYLISKVDSQTKQITKLTDDISSIASEAVRLKNIIKENTESKMDVTEEPTKTLYPLHLWSNGIEFYYENPEIATKLFFERRQLYEKINPEYFEGLVTKEERDRYIGRWIDLCWKQLSRKEKNKEFLDLNSAGMISWDELNRLDSNASQDFLMKFDPEVAKQLSETPN
tara:strand:- start:121 stop:759 length:639 start_codon:yes stop_codon:yes gene_type:complete